MKNQITYTISIIISVLLLFLILNNIQELTNLLRQEPPSVELVTIYNYSTYWLTLVLLIKIILLSMVIKFIINLYQRENLNKNLEDDIKRKLKEFENMLDKFNNSNKPNKSTSIDKEIDDLYKGHTFDVDFSKVKEADVEKPKVEYTPKQEMQMLIKADFNDVGITKDFKYYTLDLLVELASIAKDKAGTEEFREMFHSLEDALVYENYMKERM